MTESTDESRENEIALAVDLDGTLVSTDTLYESYIECLKKNFLNLCCTPGWLRRGKAVFKAHISANSTIDVEVLPYEDKALAFIQKAKKAGRKVVLATAAHVDIAKRVADKIGLFDEVFATTGKVNLSGGEKKAALIECFGENRFDYMGNDYADSCIWEASRKVIMVNAPAPLIKDIKRKHAHVEVISVKPNFLRYLIKAMRPHQWLKNLLLFIPLLAGQHFSYSNNIRVLAAFLCFCLTASSVYIVNDLTDLSADRRHPRKKNRPLAIGLLPIDIAVVAAAFLLFISFFIAPFVSISFFWILLVYLIATNVYSFHIKTRPLLDIMTLLGLYTIRIYAGAMAIGVPVTSWLLAFSIFLFTNLALVKRYTEIVAIAERGEKVSNRRGYLAKDAQLLMSLGTSTGIAAVLTLALYINELRFSSLYKSPEFLWGVCPILFYWILRMWLAAQRGKISDDPIVFAFKDRGSQITIGISLVPIALALRF